jgi:hypothetical protein
MSIRPTSINCLSPIVLCIGIPSYEHTVKQWLVVAAAQKTVTYRSLRSSNSSPGAIGRHNFDLKIDGRSYRGCRLASAICVLSARPNLSNTNGRPQ